ncbi:MAG TPA: NUDIX hydrolase [Candidatus Binatia bacterium]|nr:NUDIX hydrolase [Candidatus Binatia bacterium]
MPTSTGRNPWRRLARRLVYRNPWIEVVEDSVVRPDGEPGIYGVVHFRNRAVGVVAFEPPDQVLLVGQYRYTLDAYSWEIPEGGVPEGEDLRAGAERELAEETGYRARTWRELVRVHTSNSVTDEVGAVFLATDLVPGEARPDGTEELAVRWLPLGEALAMIDRGEITDALSQVGLLRVALELGIRPPAAR